MNPRTPELIRPMLDAFQARLDERLPGYLTGLYLYTRQSFGGTYRRLSSSH